MYTTIQRFMAFVLLVGHTLMSCSNPHIGIAKQKQENSQLEKVSPAHQEGEAPALTGNQAQEYDKVVVEGHYQRAQVQENLVQLARTDADLCTGPLTTQKGHQVSFIQQEGYWWARVKENCPPGWARTLTLPVLYPQRTYLADSASLPYTVEALLSAPIALQQQAMHIAFPEQASNKQGFVYTGPAMGLLGGMKGQECIYKDWKGKNVCPSGQHLSGQNPIENGPSAEQPKNHINRDHAQADFDNYLRGTESTFRQHGQQQDFFERVKNADREFEAKLEELHLAQEKRRETEHQEMRQRNDAWLRKQAERKQQLLEEEAKQKEEELYKEKCRLKGEAWLQEEAERKQREQEAKGKREKEAKKKQEESQRAIEEAYKKQQEAWDQEWKAHEKAHEAYVRQKEKEQQEAADLEEIAKRRSQEKAREEAEEEQRLLEEAKRKQEQEENKKLREQRRLEEEAEAFARKLQEDIKKSIQVNIPPIPAFTPPPFLDLSRWQEEEIKLAETHKPFKQPIIKPIPGEATKCTPTREIGVEKLDPIASYELPSSPSQESVAQKKEENTAQLVEEKQNKLSEKGIQLPAFFQPIKRPIQTSYGEEPVTTEWRPTTEISVEEKEDLSSFSYTPIPTAPTKGPSFYNFDVLPGSSSPTRVPSPSIEELLAETGSFELDIEAEAKKIEEEIQAELGNLDTNNYLAPKMERILLPKELLQLQIRRSIGEAEYEELQLSDEKYFAFQQEVGNKFTDDKKVAQQKEEEKEEREEEKQPSLVLRKDNNNEPKTANSAKEGKTLTQQPEVPTFISVKESAATKITIQLENVAAGITTYLQAVLENKLAPTTQKEKGQALLQQLAELEQQAVVSNQQDQHNITDTENSEMLNQHLTQELISKEAALAKMQELRGQLLAVLKLNREELKACGIERDKSKGLVLNMPSMPWVDTAHLPSKDQLQETVTIYLEKCDKDTNFKKLLEAYSLAVTKLESCPTNPTLQANKADKEAILYAHPLYQEGFQLTMMATYLRQAAEEAADLMDIRAVEAEGGHGVSARDIATAQQQLDLAKEIRERMVVLLRDIFECPHTPKGSKKWASVAKGAAKSIEDTGRGALIIGSLPLLLTALGIKAEESLNKWEDKLGIKEKCVSAKEAIETIFKEAKYDWENPEEYKAREQAIKKHKASMLAYDKAFNAERYHGKQAEFLGYASMEAFQFVFAEMVKVASQARKVVTLQQREEVAKTVGGALKGSEVAELQQREEVAKTVGGALKGGEVAELQRGEEVAKTVGGALKGSEVAELQQREEVAKTVGGALKGSEVAELQQREEVAKTMGEALKGSEVAELQRFEEIIGKMEIQGSKGMVNKEFVYNVDYFKSLEGVGKGDMLSMFAGVSKQAKEAGATSVRLNFNDIVNNRLRILFRGVIKNYEGKMMGWKVEGTTIELDSYVTLTKDL